MIIRKPTSKEVKKFNVDLVIDGEKGNQLLFIRNDFCKAEIDDPQKYLITNFRVFYAIDYWNMLIEFSKIMRSKQRRGLKKFIRKLEKLL